MNEEQLQELLSVYRLRQPMPVVAARSRSRLAWWLAAAAAVAVIAVSAVIWQMRWHEGLRVLRAGDTIATPARIRSAPVGYVDIAANTIVRYEGGNRLSLEHGTIHAKTIAPPGIFIVDTPAARAVDLGCEYVLTVGEDGEGELRVLSGWVGLNSWGQSLVPQGAKATIARDGRLSPPLFEDAPPAFQQAILRGDLKSALPLARRKDALTLINLFRFATTEERLEIYDRLDELVPAPPDVPREAMRQWTMTTLNSWWPLALRASGVSAIKKKQRPL